MDYQQLSANCSRYFGTNLNRRFPGAMEEIQCIFEDIPEMSGAHSIYCKITLASTFTQTVEFESVCYELMERIFRMHGVLIEYSIEKEL